MNLTVANPTAQDICDYNKARRQVLERMALGQSQNILLAIDTRNRHWVFGSQIIAGDQFECDGMGAQLLHLCHLERDTTTIKAYNTAKLSPIV